MKRPIKIGFLAPFSTIYPSLSQDMTDGLMSGLPQNLHSFFEFIPVFIRQGEPNAIEPVLQKLLAFDRVDMVTGYVGYRSITRFQEFFERYNTIGFFADMGEYLPFKELQSEFLFFNSFQLWQAEYAMGYWAQKTFEGKGAIFMPVYEAGYHMHSAFRHGIIAANNVPVDLAMVPYLHDKEHSITESLLQYTDKFKKERPSYLHALFSGKEAKEFLSVFHQTGLHRELPLIVTPHMASNETLDDLKHLDMSFYSASMWNPDADNPVNTHFRKTYIQRTGLMPNAFSLMGYEIGLALEMIFPSLEKRANNEIKEMLRTNCIKSPRGEHCFSYHSKHSTPIVDIEKVSIGNRIKKVVVEQGRAMPHNHATFDAIHYENVTGWLNAYLCV